MRIALDTLDDDTLLCIFSTLTVPDLLSLRQVSQTRSIITRSFLLIRARNVRHAVDSKSSQNSRSCGRTSVLRRSCSVAYPSLRNLSRVFLSVIWRKGYAEPTVWARLGKLLLLSSARPPLKRAEEVPFKRFISFQAMAESGS